MKVIKLDAIDSTNDFLKQLSQNQEVENLTVVTAKKQWKGRGQMGSKWEVEDGKNLIVSILVKDLLKSIESVFDLNIAVALAMVEVLEYLQIPNVTVKWPNDIMAGNKKIGGILIENLFKSDHAIVSIIGLGLNVNQTSFENLPKASSLKNVTGIEFEIEEILLRFLAILQNKIDCIDKGQTIDLWQNYHEKLFKIGKPAVFQNASQEHFMGIIQKVNKNGLLEVLLEDDTIQTYGIKEVSMVY